MTKIVKKLLVTGGCGYIGSHTVIELLQKDYEVVVFDNLSNSSRETINRINEITKKTVQFVNGDIRDYNALIQVLRENYFDAVLHFAGLKSVGESLQNPHLYYENNVLGSLTLLKAMSKSNVKTIVFSSSATVYSEFEPSPIKERMKTVMPNNPYGASKLIVEKILSDTYKSDSDWCVFILRYFNPVGAHPSGLVGESPLGEPNNLMPLIGQAAIGRLNYLSVFGNDYNTPDGTCIRDFIHVVDLAKGHIKALQKCNKKQGVSIVNLGTGIGHSVMKIIEIYKSVNDIKIPIKIVKRRPGDVPISYADARYAKDFLNWKAELDVESMCRDAWNWHLRNKM